MSAKLIFLKTDSDFSNFRKSRLYSSDFLRLRIFRAPNQSVPRFGFIIPKKTIKKVTLRNVVKRRIKSILQKKIETIKPLDILFFPGQKTTKMKFADLEADIIQLLTKAHAL